LECVEYNPTREHAWKSVLDDVPWSYRTWFLHFLLDKVVVEDSVVDLGVELRSVVVAVAVAVAVVAVAPLLDLVAQVMVEVSCWFPIQKDQHVTMSSNDCCYYKSRMSLWHLPGHSVVFVLTPPSSHQRHRRRRRRYHTPQQQPYGHVVDATYRSWIIDAVKGWCAVIPTTNY
jgi:hypothetical protein